MLTTTSNSHSLISKIIISLLVFGPIISGLSYELSAIYNNVAANHECNGASVNNIWYHVASYAWASLVIVTILFITAVMYAPYTYEWSICEWLGLNVTAITVIFICVGVGGLRSLYVYENAKHDCTDIYKIYYPTIWTILKTNAFVGCVCISVIGVIGVIGVCIIIHLICSLQHASRAVPS